MSDPDEDTESTEHGGTSAAEYAAGGLGGLLVLLLVAFLGYQALAVRDSGPDLAVEVTDVRLVGTGYEVRLEVTNDGGTTAEAVHLGGELARDGRQVEQASASISYVPPDSRREAVLVFTADPRDGDLAVGVEGYRPA
ncbi:MULTISPECIES: hypothetical protein [unclassified Modestobacter]|uniref:hypothetical protein n=1 Tax=unclassified Modestobacter TaxID=2643866 RepID=UPI0022AA4C51|nr:MULTISPECIES: hypothetical protein [unclassified Modestobacter]MCZ2824477.1 hypothetical protein [Modestobacter sp. VKM Ac-2981]MCZ2853995.1 hypothetical protein [Modestobacter sp. VKM Ac-2982]